MSAELRQKASALEGLQRSDAWAYMSAWLLERRDHALRHMTQRAAEDGDRFWAASEYNLLNEVLGWPEAEAAFCRRQLAEEAMNA